MFHSWCTCITYSIPLVQVQDEGEGSLNKENEEPEEENAEQPQVQDSIASERAASESQVLPEAPFTPTRQQPDVIQVKSSKLFINTLRWTCQIKQTLHNIKFAYY